jgi:hypothetical protein
MQAWWHTLAIFVFRSLTQEELEGQPGLHSKMSSIKNLKECVARLPAGQGICWASLVAEPHLWDLGKGHRREPALQSCGSSHRHTNNEYFKMNSLSKNYPVFSIKNQDLIMYFK